MKEKREFRKIIVKSTLINKGEEKFKRFLPDRLKEYIKKEELQLVNGEWRKERRETNNLIEL